MSPQRDIFISLPPTQTAVDGSQWVEHSPVSTITSSSPIEFIVSGSGEDYMDLNKTKVKACIKTTNIFLVDAVVVVAPINNTLHSRFSQIDVSLNDVTYRLRPPLTHIEYTLKPT